MNNIDFKSLVQSIKFFIALFPKKEFDRLKLLKLLWFADRYHLYKYGVLLFSSDRYVMMKHGPVLSTVNDVLKKEFSFIDSDIAESYVDENIETDGDTVKVKGNIDEEFLSESQKEALIFTYKRFGGKNLIKFSHLFPEWKNNFSDYKNRVEITSLELLEELDDDAKRTLDDDIIEIFTISKEKKDFLADMM